MGDAQTKASRSLRPRAAAALAGTYLLCAAVGFAVGRTGSLSAVLGLGRPAPTSLARIGYLLSGKPRPQGWPPVAEDLSLARARLTPPTPDILELVVQLTGLRRGGEPEWDEAERTCRGLKWPVCARPMLEEMRAEFVK